MNDDLVPHLRPDPENFSRSWEGAITTRRRRSTVHRDAYRAAHWYFLVRAILPGPVYLAGYLLRRAAWKATRRMR